MQSLEEVRENFYQNKWVLMATEILARSMVEMIQLTSDHSWPEMERTICKL